MSQNKRIAENTIVVIFAAGKGSRMGRSDLCKVCFEIDSVPAISRTIDTFRKQRFSRFMLVVGDKAQQVMESVRKALARLYYRPRNLKPATTACIAAEGAGLVEF